MVNILAVYSPQNGLTPKSETHLVATLPQGKDLGVGKKRVNKYPVAFRQMALERMKNCASVSALAEELGVHRTVLYHWQRQLEAGHDGTPTSAIRQLRKEVRDLKRVLAEKTLEAERH